MGGEGLSVCVGSLLCCGVLAGLADGQAGVRIRHGATWPESPPGLVRQMSRVSNAASDWRSAFPQSPRRKYSRTATPETADVSPCLHIRHSLSVAKAACHDDSMSCSCRSDLNLPLTPHRDTKPSCRHDEKLSRFQNRSTHFVLLCDEKVCEGFQLWPNREISRHLDVLAVDSSESVLELLSFDARLDSFEPSLVWPGLMYK
ncbi:unnamed protein product [Protopolystoma xenopodis]|uniref:Uncharacterized protein n=1 Tax=Protopolystoma xenopodis TaxID=117903 RepID=A0A3S5BPA0_9PLAT|nr:unnamed protein product [Protopolystoma xenopodis]